MQINKINYLKYKEQQRQNKGNTSFTGIATVIPKFLQAADANPIMGVTLIDLSSMIIPRTIIDANRTNDKGQKNGFAAVETFARESMGLLVNCLSPALVALGIGSLAKDQIIGKEFKHLRLHKFLGDNDSIHNASNAWQKASSHIDDGTNAWIKTHAKGVKPKDVIIRQAVKNILKDIEGVDGTLPPVKFAERVPKEERTRIYNKITQEILKAKKEGKANLSPKVVRELHTDIVKVFGASKNIRYISEGTNAPFKYAMQDIIRDSSALFKAFSDDAVNSKNIKTLTSKIKNLNKFKGISGLLLIMGIGLGTQKVNRMITEKRSGKKGFPGYKDFNKEGGLALSQKEKKGLVFNKAIAAAAMMGLAALTLKKTPINKLFQFRGWFPTMDQAKVISATTYTGRLLAADDKNELRESGIRDALGYLNLYVLGDYVAKALATRAQKKNPGANFLNEMIEPKAGANKLQQFWHWVRNVSTKSVEEIAGSSYKKEFAEKGYKVLSEQTRKNKVSWFQAGGIIYSMAVLGLLLPKFNIWMTEKSKAKRAIKQQNAIANPNPNLSMMSNSLMTKKTKDLFSEFTK